MRVVFNHLTIGLVYQDFWRLGPAFIGAFVSIFYQLINIYGLLPAVLLAVMGLGTFSTIISYSLHLLSLLFIPLPNCILVTFSFLIISFLAWLFINININRKANLKIFKLNYSSRTAFILLSILLCNQVLALNISSKTRFWDVHFKPSLAGKIKKYDSETLNKLVQEDYLSLQQVLGDKAVLYGCTPGSLLKYFNHLQLDKSNYQVIKTILPPEHAKVFGLIRDFYLHVVTL